MSNKIKTPVTCTRCDFKCKIDAVLASSSFGILQRYYPTLAGETQYTYIQNNKTKEVPILKSKAEAIKFGLKIAKICPFGEKKR